MGRQKHKPVRTCIVCREAQDKRTLVRVVRSPEGNIFVDPTGKANGRGAYLCHKAQCWEKGLHKRLLANALKATPSDEEIAVLEKYRETEFSKV